MRIDRRLKYWPRLHASRYVIPLIGILTLSTLVSETLLADSGFLLSASLSKSGMPAVGPCDIEVNIWDGPSPTDSTIVDSFYFHRQELAQGRLSIGLPLEDSIKEGLRWLELGAQCGEDGAYSYTLNLIPVRAILEKERGKEDASLTITGVTVTGKSNIGGELKGVATSLLKVSGGVALTDLLDLSGSNFFGSCAAGSAIRSVASHSCPR